MSVHYPSCCLHKDDRLLPADALASKLAGRPGNTGLQDFAEVDECCYTLENLGCTVDATVERRCDLPVSVWAVMPAAEAACPSSFLLFQWSLGNLWCCDLCLCRGRCNRVSLAFDSCSNSWFCRFCFGLEYSVVSDFGLADALDCFLVGPALLVH